jgi:tetratricopeptide (TPR) repeat protein
VAIIKLTCEECGGRIELDDTQEFGFCIYCKAKMLIKNDTIINEVTQNITKQVYGHQGKDIDELVADGNKLLEFGDDKKANVKFKQAINIEPNSWAAWFGYAATGGDKTGYLSCVPAYKNAYNVATEENQKLATFTDMTRYLPDHSLGKALIDAYKVAPLKKRHEMFDLVLGVIGCDESEIFALGIDLCPDDWRTWFAQAKIRQIRVRWCELEGGFLTGKRLPKDANDVLNIFLCAYQLAVNESVEAKNIVISHISSMEKDGSYKNFIRVLNARIRGEG